MGKRGQLNSCLNEEDYDRFLQVVKAENSSMYQIVKRAVLEYVYNHEIFGGEGLGFELKKLPSRTRRRQVKNGSSTRPSSRGRSLVSSTQRELRKSGELVEIEEGSKIYKLVSKERADEMLKTHPERVWGSPEWKNRLRSLVDDVKEEMKEEVIKVDE